MIFIFAIVSPALSDGTPASDLDGEDWSFTDTTFARAEERARRRLDETFALASPERRLTTSLRYLGSFSSLKVFRDAWRAA